MYLDGVVMASVSTGNPQVLPFTATPDRPLCVGVDERGDRYIHADNGRGVYKFNGQIRDFQFRLDADGPL